MPGHIAAEIQWEAPIDDLLESKIIDIARADLVALEISWKDSKGELSVLGSVSGKHWAPLSLEYPKINGKPGVWLYEYPNASLSQLKVAFRGKGSLECWVNKEGR